MLVVQIWDSVSCYYNKNPSFYNLLSNCEKTPKKEGFITAVKKPGCPPHQHIAKVWVPGLAQGNGPGHVQMADCALNLPVVLIF